MKRLSLYIISILFLCGIKTNAQTVIHHLEDVKVNGLLYSLFDDATARVGAFYKDYENLETATIETLIYRQGNGIDDNPEYFTVTHIDHYGFKGCENLRHITIPNTIKYIYEYAFEDCKRLREIRLPESLEFVGERIFVGCDVLVDVYCAATTPPRTARGDNPFELYPALAAATLHVPKGCKYLYDADDEWYQFGHIVEEDFSEVELIEIEEDSGEVPSTYYNLQGIRVEHPIPGVLYVKLHGNKASKVIF